MPKSSKSSFTGLSGARKGAAKNNVDKGTVKKSKSGKADAQHLLFTERLEP